MVEKIELPKVSLFQKLNAEFKMTYSSDIQIKWTDFTTDEMMTKLCEILETNEEWKHIMYSMDTPVHKIPDSNYNAIDPYFDLYCQGDESAAFNKRIPVGYLEKYEDILDWVMISTHQSLSEAMIEKFEKKVNWVLLSSFTLMSESFLAKHRNDICWSVIPSIHTGQVLSEKFIRDFANFLNWDNISTFCPLSESFIDVYSDKVNWKNISAYQTLSSSFIKKHVDDVDWELIFKHQKLSTEYLTELSVTGIFERYIKVILKNQLYDDDFLMNLKVPFSWKDVPTSNSQIKYTVEKMHWNEMVMHDPLDYQYHILDIMEEDDLTDPYTVKYGIPIRLLKRLEPSRVDWNSVSMYHLPEEFMTEYGNHLNKIYLGYNNRMSLEYIRKNRDVLDWDDMSIRCPMTMFMIAENYDKVNWELICQYQRLTEDFMRAYKKDIVWKIASRYQVLSEELMDEMKDSLDWFSISKYQRLSEKFMRAHAQYIEWNIVSRYQDMSEYFVNEFKDKLVLDAVKAHKDETERKERKTGTNFFNDACRNSFKRYVAVTGEAYDEKRNLLEFPRIATPKINMDNSEK